MDWFLQDRDLRHAGPSKSECPVEAYIGPYQTSKEAVTGGVL